MRLVESDEGGSRMGIEYKCEWEELYISFDMHTRTHACILIMARRYRGEGRLWRALV